MVTAMWPCFKNLNYIYAGGSLVAICEKTLTTETLHYVYTDHLGSLRYITDASCTVEQRLGFDAWGNRRDPITGNYSSMPINTLTARGFTGHEHLDEFALINMNGRVYDPSLGVFLSPDNYMSSPDFTQGFNRYTYGMNNPLMYTDPDGNNPLLIGMLLLSGGITLNGIGEMTNNSTLSNIGSGMMIGGGILTGVGFGSFGLAGSMLGNGFVGGIGSAANGGSFNQGFLSGALPGAIFAGINAGWNALGGINVPSSVASSGYEPLSAGRGNWYSQAYKAIRDFGNSVPAVITDGLRSVPQALADLPERVAKPSIANKQVTSVGQNANNSGYSYSWSNSSPQFAQSKGGTKENINYTGGPYTSWAGIIGQAAELGAKEVRNAGAPVKFVGKWATRVGWGGEIISNVINGINVYNNPTWGNYGRLAVSLGTTATNFIPYAGPMISFGLSAYDAGGGFNDFYDALDMDQTLYKNTGIIIAPSVIPGMSIPTILTFK